jgi:hypothetical protein
MQAAMQGQSEFRPFDGPQRQLLQSLSDTLHTIADGLVG